MSNRTRTLLPLIVLLVLAPAIVGCSDVRVSTDYDPSVDFTTFDTFSWTSSPFAHSARGGVPDDRLAAQIRNDVADVLGDKGLTLTGRSEASVLVSHHVTVEPRVAVHRRYTATRSGVRHYSRSWIEEYERGTLVIDVVDAATNQLVWRGSARSRLPDGRTAEQRNRLVRDAVERILARFPPT